MKEAISKYTALEVLHIMGPKREEAGRRREPAWGTGQGGGGSAPPCQLVRAAAGGKLRAPGTGLLTDAGGKPRTGPAMGGSWLGEVCR